MWAVILMVSSTLVSQLIMAFYPLTEARFLEIVREIADRRAARPAAGRDGEGVGSLTASS